jgi:hypothetical protein
VKILMFVIVIGMIGGVLSIALFTSPGSNQIAKGQPLQTSLSQVMGPR